MNEEKTEPKAIIFEAPEGVINPELLKQLMFAEITDPRIMGYKRNLVRPELRKKMIISDMAVIAGTAVLTACSRKKIFKLGGAVFLGAFLLWRLKDMEIEAVHIYQRYAPDWMRNRCRFEPSCSDYMILAIEKYGRFRGVVKGIDRIYRCGTHDGGYDMP